MSDRDQNPSDEEYNSDGEEPDTEDEEHNADEAEHDSNDEASLSTREASLAMYFGSRFSGPLPPPDAFGEYENVLPGAADRILGMAEYQLQHRASSQKMGLWIMFVIAIGFLVASVALAVFAAPAAAVLFPVVPTLVSGGAYIYGLRKRSEPPQLPTGDDDDQPKLPPAR